MSYLNQSVNQKRYILCVQKLGVVNLVYRTQPETKQLANTKAETKTDEHRRSDEET